MRVLPRLLTSSIATLALWAASSPARAEPEVIIDPSSLRIIKSESGPVNYYSVMSEGGTKFVRARYVPPTKTAVLGFQTADGDRRTTKKLRWTWRAMTLPNGGDECASGKEDSAAVVYVTWKRGLRYYAIKYVWSAVGKKGSVCDSMRNPFAAQDTVIVESGGPVGVWRSVEIDLAHHFRHHFANDDQTASVPDFVGAAVMTDGDQTNSASAADYGPFVLVR